MTAPRFRDMEHVHTWAQDQASPGGPGCCEAEYDSEGVHVLRCEWHEERLDYALEQYAAQRVARS